MDDWTTRSLSEPQTTLLNDYCPNFHHRAQDAELDHFSLFGRLPAEIRIKIWEHALPQERLIDVEIGHPDDQWYSTQKDASDDDIKQFVARTGQRYCLTFSFVTRYQPLTLLAVNKEARQVARDIFRIRMPVRFSQYSLLDVPLDFSPDRDMLSVGDDTDASDLLADVLADFVLHDPKGKGIRHLVFNLPGIPNELSYLPLRPNRIPEKTRETFKVALMNLERVFFSFRKRVDVQDMKPYLNRSLPLMGAEQVVTILPADPRRIELDLDEVMLHCDPEPITSEWEKMEDVFQVVRPKGVDRPLFQLMLMASPRRRFRLSRINRRAAFAPHPMCVEKFFAENVYGDGKPVKDGILNPDAPAEMHRVPLTAVGFWIFPVAALDHQKWKAGKTQWDLDIVGMDFKRHPPQLGLFHLQ